MDAEVSTPFKKGVLTQLVSSKLSLEAQTTDDKKTKDFFILLKGNPGKSQTPVNIHSLCIHISFIFSIC